MSAVSDFLTTGAFWWGTGLGTVLGASITAGINSWTTHRSDSRKFEQEDTRDERTADRDNRKQEEQHIYEAATEFATQCSEIVTNAIDVKGAFNFLRDAYSNQADLPDSKALEKFMVAETGIEATKAIATPFNRLKMVAPVELLTRATQLNASILTLTKTTTEPFARVVTLKAAGDELDKFVNAFRESCGREQYLPSAAQRDALSFMETLRHQVNDFMEESKKEMNAAGFKTTPWD